MEIEDCKKYDIDGRGLGGGVEVGGWVAEGGESWTKYKVGQYKQRTIKGNVDNCLNKR